MVAAAIGGDRGLDVAMAFLEDKESSIRRLAYQMGVDAGKAGEGLVREAAENADEDLACDAIALLTEREDRAATTLMRKLLNSPHARVRAASCRLLGKIAGFAVSRQIEPLLDDVDEDVRRAAREAINHIMGQDGPVLTPPPPAPRDVAPTSTPSNDWAVAAAPTEAPNAPPPPGTPAPPGSAEELPNLAALREATTSSGGLAPAKKAAPPTQAGPQMVPTPQLPAAPIEYATGAAWAPEEPIPLPAQLPIEAMALARLLGQVSVNERPAVIEVLRRCSMSEVGAVLSGHSPGKDIHRARGAAIAAEAMGNQRWVGTLRKYIRDPDAGVRACAIIALAKLASPSLLPQMSRLASDSDAGVRASAAWALGEAGRKLGTQGMVRGYISPLTGDGDAEVKKAAEEALAALE